MAKLVSIKSKLLKNDDGEIINPNVTKLNQQMAQLEPGIYTLIIHKEDIALQKKKKFYFKMETELAKHLGYKKPELHEVLKSHVGLIINTESEIVYESIADVKTEDRMMERILELQEFASLQFNYKCEPYVEE